MKAMLYFKKIKKETKEKKKKKKKKKLKIKINKNKKKKKKIIRLTLINTLMVWIEGAVVFRRTHEGNYRKEKKTKQRKIKAKNTSKRNETKCNPLQQFQPPTLKIITITTSI